MKSMIEPLCPVFGACGGCAYQDISYPEELAKKERLLKQLFQGNLGLGDAVFDPVVASPEPYHYRNRLDLTLRRIKGGEIGLGFQPPLGHRLISIEACAIAREEISGFIPELTKQAARRLPADYRVANLVVRTGDDGKVLWGGIGRGSLALEEKDYLWTEIRGKRIFYSLDTFFQANLSILPLLMDRIRDLAVLDSKTILFDLYAGVGLFGIYFADRAGRVVMIEENASSLKLAGFNRAYHKMDQVEIRAGRVETELPLAASPAAGFRQAAIVDPPRRGLSPEALKALAAMKQFDSLFYLSCHVESLARDLGLFMEAGWHIEKVVPFDFFPKTLHLETLVLLKP